TASSRVTRGSVFISDSPLAVPEQAGIALGARLLLDLVDAAVLELLLAAARAGIVPPHPRVIDPGSPRQELLEFLEHSFLLAELLDPLPARLLPGGHDRIENPPPLGVSQ